LAWRLSNTLDASFCLEALGEAMEIGLQSLTGLEILYPTTPICMRLRQHGASQRYRASSDYADVRSIVPVKTVWGRHINRSVSHRVFYAGTPLQAHNQTRKD